ncbi:hypothetical protein LXL04_008878 [Taraxacum kok-saghyz]
MAAQNPNPEPSEQFSFPDTASSFPILKIKNNNLYLNLVTVLQPRARFFDSSFKSIFVCLKHSKISTALTLSCSVPISVLSRAYATARYDKPTETMYFNLSSDKATSITKQHFYKLLHLPFSTDLTHPDSISNVDLINMCNQMGHDPFLETVSKINKSKMQPRWNLLASIILRCFAERTTGSDNASKLLLTLIYAIYTNSNIDIGHILWTQFCSSPNSSTRTTNISMARFWSIVVDGALSKFVELRGDSSTQKAEISELQVNKLQFVKDRVFPHCGEIPNEMWSVVPEDEPQKKKVKKDNKGVLPPLVVREIPADVQPEQEQTPPRKKKSKSRKASKKPKKPKKTAALQDENQTKQPKKPEAGSSKTRPQTPPEKDTTFDNLGNIENLTQTPPVPPHEKENPEQTNKPSPTQSESERVDENIEMEGPSDELFNPNKASSAYVPPTDRFTFFSVSFEEEPLPSEQEDLFATKKDVYSLCTMMNTILVGMDPLKITQQEELAKKHSEEVREIRKEILTSIDTLQADFTSKVSDVEKKIDGIAQTATSESELKAQVHAQEIKLKELATQLESKTHEAEHRQRVIDMYKVQNQEMNLKLVKLVEDKDSQVQKLSEKLDTKVEQLLKAISEISVPKVVEKIVEKKDSTKKSPPKQSKQQKQTKKPDPKRPILKGVIINPDEGSSKQKPQEPEVPGKGKQIQTSDPKAASKENPDTSKDEEIARKAQEEERIKASAQREEKQIRHSELRIWPIWTREKVTKAALTEPDPYWLHPIADQRVNLDANFQLDMPLCPRAFIFKYMDLVPYFSGDDEAMNKILIDFYTRKSKPQQEVWSCIPIKTVPRIRRTSLVSNSFYNWEFEITRGTEKTASSFTYADIPLMNSSDWINIHQIFVIKCDDYLKPHIKVFKLLMQNYMFEMGKFDLVAAELMKRVPKTVTVNDVVKYGHLMMTDLFTMAPNHLCMLKQKIYTQSRNSAQDRKEVLDRIIWYEAVRSKIIKFFNFIQEHEEK